MKLKEQPYNLLLLTGLLMILTSFFVLNKESAFDLHWQDTYLVLSASFLIQLFGFIAILIWALYLVSKRIIYSKTLTWIHVFISILTLAFILALGFFEINLFNSDHRRYYDYSEWQTFQKSGGYNDRIALMLGILLIGQLFFILNFIIGLVKHISKHPHGL